MLLRAVMERCAPPPRFAPGEEEASAPQQTLCGPWSRRLLRALGTDVPLDVERGYGIDLPEAGFTLTCPVILADDHVALTPHRGGLRLSGRNELAGIDSPARYRLTTILMRAAKRFFPELNTTGARPWMRRRPSMPDSLPVIGRAPRQDNVYLAFGHGHKGLGMAAITGQLVRELIDGAEPSVDLTPFRPTRFRTAGRASNRFTISAFASNIMA